MRKKVKVGLKKDTLVWAVIPAYNEKRYIGRVLRETKDYVNHIVVVDDGSKDETSEIARKNNAIVLNHSINLGKGAALKTGCEYVIARIKEKRRNKMDQSSERFEENMDNIIVLMDSDGQHKAEDIPRLIEKIKGNDIVFASRKINNNMPFIFRIGNFGINQISKILFNVNVRDSQSGFRAFKSSIYGKIKWNALDYSVESEMIANVGKNKLRYGEIMIDTIYNESYKGTTIIDGIKIVLRMFRIKFFG